ncbi:unnamed protein product [Menidia menidia]|uniref:(Atlantic silverside) hypothetical protein n=1 Tax=Menidia menidia TaxID=238744 RepID=A0A8S4ASM9_9TELE|nr:unnamed protein product [Menidia menidia]
MSEQTTTSTNKAAKNLRDHSAEEKAVKPPDTDDQKWIQRHGHKGILTNDPESKMDTITTSKATYVAPKSPGVRLQGIRAELLKMHIAQTVSEKVRDELTLPTPKTDYRTTQRDYCVEGFVPSRPQPTKVHDYKTDQAITFWSENHQRIQGMTASPVLKAPFRKSALFSTPIGERLDEPDLPPDN